MMTMMSKVRHFTQKRIVMKVLSKITLTTLLFSAATAQASLFSISEKEINQYLETRLAEKVPLQDKVGVPGLLQLNYHLHSLNTRIGQTEEKKVEITGVIDSKLATHGRKYDIQLKLNMDTVPYYNPEEGAVYLKDVRLLSWQSNSQKYNNELQMFLPLLVDGMSRVLNNTPVYKLDENKTKESLVKKFGKAIIVEKGALRLETQIF